MTEAKYCKPIINQLKICMTEADIVNQLLIN